MTSSKPSDPSASPESTSVEPTSSSSAEPRFTSLRGEAVCEKCSGPMRLRGARPFPVALQVSFGASFLVFLYVQAKGFLPPKALWVWSAFQLVLGIALVKARHAAAKKVFICLRCGAILP